jgi:GMP synthase-like glutamine amidotransferase
VKALHIHHDASSSAGVIGELVSDRGIDSVQHQVCLQAGSPAGNAVFPNPAEFDLIFVYGSRWSVYEEAVAHWVTPELEFLRQADVAGVAVLGMCFGGQLLSAAHGGGVAPGHTPEIGWLSIEPDAESGRSVVIDSGPWMQWHFDCFEIPDGAQPLAHSSAGPQAFLLRNNLAVQFHPEVNRLVLEEWLIDDLDQLADLGVDPEPLLTEADRQLQASRERAARLLDYFLPS